MRQKTFYRAAFLVVCILTVATISHPVYAADPIDSSDNRLGVTPMAPMTEPLPRYDNTRQIVPGPPVQPNVVSRPASWPGGSISASQPNSQYPSTSAPFNATPQTTQFFQPGQNPQNTYTQPPPANMTPGGVPPQCPPASPVELCESTEIFARVGSEAIFAYEIMGTVNEALENYKGKYPPEQLDMFRAKLINDRLLSRIESKLIYLDAKGNIPAEGIANFEKQITKYFDSTELPNMIKRSGVSSGKELDEKLRAFGSSLEREKKTFIERTLAQEWVRQKVKRDEEITYDQMLKYYREHQPEFEKPAQTKWEEIAVQFSRFPSKAEAYNAIAQMGNKVMVGTSFAEVAKNGSQGPTANKGGAYGWTTKGSLKYEQIDIAIFKLPVGRLSQIIETEKGYHIVRVTERIETQVTPFLTAQVEIKEKIVQERTNKQIQDYLSRLEDKIPIWTKFDGDRKNIRIADRRKEMSR